MVGYLMNSLVLFYCAETGLEVSSVDLGRAFEDPCSAASILLTLFLGRKTGGDGAPEAAARQGQLAGLRHQEPVCGTSLHGAGSRRKDSWLFADVSILVSDQTRQSLEGRKIRLHSAHPWPKYILNLVVRKSFSIRNDGFLHLPCEEATLFWKWLKIYFSHQYHCLMLFFSFLELGKQLI